MRFNGDLSCNYDVFLGFVFQVIFYGFYHRIHRNQTTIYGRIFFGTLAKHPGSKSKILMYFLSNAIMFVTLRPLLSSNHQMFTGQKSMDFSKSIDVLIPCMVYSPTFS